MLLSSYHHSTSEHTLGVYWKEREKVIIVKNAIFLGSFDFLVVSTDAVKKHMTLYKNLGALQRGQSQLCWHS